MINKTETSPQYFSTEPSDVSDVSDVSDWSDHQLVDS